MDEKSEQIADFFSIIEEGLDNEAYKAADKIAEVGGEEVIQKLIELLSTSTNQNTLYLAARALSKCENKDAVIDTVFELIKNTKDSFLKGVLTEALAGFDCSEYFVELFKLYLFGSLKVSAMAKEVLDEQEFAITPRVIRKAEKHYKHYLHNIKKEEALTVKQTEIEEMLQTMKELFDGEEETEDDLDE